MSKPKELDLAEIAELPPFLLMGSWMCALFGTIVAYAFGATEAVAMGAGVLPAALFVGLVFDGFLQRSRTEARWALGFTIALWLAICGALAQTAGFMIFVGAGMIGVGAYLIKRQRCGAKGRE